MKKLVYVLLSFVFVPVVTLFTDPNSEFFKHAFGYVENSNVDAVITESEADSDEVVAFEEDVYVDIEIPEKVTLVSSAPSSISSEGVSEVKRELKEWRSKLPKSDRKLLRKLVIKRRRRHPNAPILNKAIAEKLLKRGQARRGVSERPKLSDLVDWVG